MAETMQRHKRGGLYFEDFEVGKTYEHRYTRTVTQMDNMLFSNMTLNPQPLHIDRHFCETETEWGQPLMNSLFTLGLMIGMSVSDLTVGTTIASSLRMTSLVATRVPGQRDSFSFFMMPRTVTMPVVASTVSMPPVTPQTSAFEFGIHRVQPPAPGRIVGAPPAAG